MAKILLTDDEAHVRHVMKFKLERAGFTVLTAGDGEEGYDTARRALPDLIVSDLQMPRLDGLGLCRKLAGDPVTSQIPVILVTSREFEVTEEDTGGTGVRRVMSKPFSPRALLAAIVEVISPPVAPAAR